MTFAKDTSPNQKIRLDYVLPAVVENLGTIIRPSASIRNLHARKPSLEHTIRLPLAMNPISPLTAAILEARQAIGVLELHNMELRRARTDRV